MMLRHPPGFDASVYCRAAAFSAQLAAACPSGIDWSVYLVERQTKMRGLGSPADLTTHDLPERVNSPSRWRQG
jgi:hypothetical protein